MREREFDKDVTNLFRYRILVSKLRSQLKSLLRVAGQGLSNHQSHGIIREQKKLFREKAVGVF